MTRHSIRHSRARRTAVSVATSAVLAAGIGPLLPTPALAVGAAQETVVPATFRSTYTSATLQSPDTTSGGDGAGAQGVFHRLEGHSGVVWTRYSDGRSFDAPPLGSLTVYGGTGSDALAYRSAGTVALWNPVDGTTNTLHVPEGQSVYSGVYGSVVATTQDVTGADGTTTKVKHLLTAGPDGTTRDVSVGAGAPAGMVFAGPLRGDASGLVFLAKLDDSVRLVDVDAATGAVRGWTPPLPSGYLSAKLSPDHVVVYSGVQSTKVLVFSRSDLSAAPTEVTLDTSSSGILTADDLSVVGDWLVHRPGGGAQVTAVPIAGGAPVTLIASSNAGISAASDGTAVTIGRTGADDWGIQRIHAGADGRPAVTLVKALPKPAYKIQGLTLDQGKLVVADTSYAGYRDDYGRTVAATGTPVFGARSSYDGTDLLVGTCPATDVGCSQLHGTADGRVAWLMKDSSANDRIRVAGPAYGFWERSVPAGGQITDVSGQYLIHTTATVQTVYRIGNDGNPALTRTPGAAALSGDTLWTEGTTPGTVTAYDLTTKKTTETLTTDAGCAPTELRANGRWLYWSCADGTAGVYDRTAKKSVPVPAGEAELGDGFVVTHDKRAGQLVLTTVADGTPVSRVIGALPDTGVSQREVRWTVDESTGNVAYVDDQERVHLVPSGVAQQPLRLLAPVAKASTLRAQEIDTTPTPLPPCCCRSRWRAGGSPCGAGPPARSWTYGTAARRAAR